MRCYLDVHYNADDAQCMNLYLPDAESFPVLVYFHGGGLTTGDKAKQEVPCQYLAEHGIGVVSANYRMYPTAKYPEFLEDAANAVAWVFENIKQYGNVTEIYVGGSSAGGYMSQLLCFDKSWLGKYGIEPTDVAGFIHDAGQPTCHFNVLRERGVDHRRLIVDEAAPLYHVGKDEQYPPMLIIVSDDDMPSRYEQTMLLLSTLKHFGHTENIALKVMHSKHCRYINLVDENGISVFGKLIEDFIRREK